MRFALVTTTINVPTVLRRYRELGPGVRFVIAGDKRSPHNEIERLARELGGCDYLTPTDQAIGYPRLSQNIGWNNIQRRNFAILRAAELRPDVIVTIDDDNLPRGDYFSDLERTFREPSPVTATGPWFNIGKLAGHSFRHRGYPVFEPSRADFVPNGKPARVGVVEGLIYGDPDIGAVERIQRNPRVLGYRRIADKGIRVDPRTTWAPINSQNTAWRAELAPLMALPPRVGRFDDIFGGFIAQPVLAARGEHIAYGRPHVRQDRNDHDLFADLRAEMYGMRITPALIEKLDDARLNTEKDPTEALATVLSVLRGDARLRDLPWDFYDEWIAQWRKS